MKIALIGIAAAALIGSAANSAPIVVNADNVPTAHVAYSDLNLASPQGRARLEGRIRAAAENLCGITGDRTIDSYLISRPCYDAAVASGLRQMNAAVQQQASMSPAIHRRAGE